MLLVTVTCGVGLGKTRLACKLQTKGTVAARLPKTNRNEVKATHTSTYSWKWCQRLIWLHSIK